jgi:hypothetical protein
MIKFFRKIRYELIEKNRTGKYLRYAIGEIALVMIGILLALQVNNWNEERKDRTSEREYLIDVHNEFILNKAMFEKTLGFYREQFKLANSIIEEFFPITDDGWPRVITKYKRVFRSQSFDPSDSSIEGLVYSGKIEIVQSDSLKRLLLSWNDKLADYKEEEKDLRAWEYVYEEVYLNEAAFNVIGGNMIRSDSITPLSNDLKLKLEKLMWERRTHLGIVTSRWKNLNSEADDLIIVIDAIISLTEVYTK